MIRNHCADCFWGCYQNNLSFTATISLIWEFSVWIHTECFSGGRLKVRKIEGNIGRTPASSGSPSSRLMLGSAETQRITLAWLDQNHWVWTDKCYYYYQRHLFTADWMKWKGEKRGWHWKTFQLSSTLPHPHSSHLHHLTLLTLGVNYWLCSRNCSEVSC